jgi:hypothetical protein
MLKTCRLTVETARWQSREWLDRVPALPGQDSTGLLLMEVRTRCFNWFQLKSGLCPRLSNDGASGGMESFSPFITNHEPGSIHSVNLNP